MEENIPGKRLVDNAFLQGDDVVHLARQLIGKRLVTRVDGVEVSGIVSETEAYRGITDKASHTWNGRRTKRTEKMYWSGGHIYVYLCYGIHALLNIVTNQAEIPDAVLIRGIVPERGKEVMLNRRRARKWSSKLTIGPGKVSQALGVQVQHSGLFLGEEKDGFRIWMEEGIIVPEQEIVTAKRVGVDYAGEDAGLLWRFIKKSPLPEK